MPENTAKAGEAAEPTQKTEPSSGEAAGQPAQPAPTPASLDEAKRLLAESTAELKRFQEGEATLKERLTALEENNQKLLQEKLDAKAAADAEAAKKLEDQGEFKALYEKTQVEHAEALQTLSTEAEALKTRDARLAEIETKQNEIVSEKIKALTDDQKAGLLSIVPDFDKLDPFDKAQRLDAYMATTGTKQATGNPGGNGVVPSLVGKNGQTDKATWDQMLSRAVQSTPR
jgi:chromosome segregation ATPase